MTSIHVYASRGQAMTDLLKWQDTRGVGLCPDDLTWLTEQLSLARGEIIAGLTRLGGRTVVHARSFELSATDALGVRWGVHRNGAAPYIELLDQQDFEAYNTEEESQRDDDHFRSSHGLHLFNL